MAKLYKTGKAPGQKAADQSKSVRFELEEPEAEEAEEKEKHREPVLGNVQERFPGFFEMPERCVPFLDSSKLMSRDDVKTKGFPQVFDCLASQANEEKGAEAAIGKGKSLFARHFDKMAEKEKQRKGGEEEEAGGGRKEAEKESDEALSTTIKNLELIEASSSGRSWEDTPGRMAMDPVQMDLASKCLRNVMPRVEQRIVRLFDPLNWNANAASGLECQAIQQLEAIRALYLEQIESEESGRRTWVFAREGMDPMGDPAWMLVPIRRVLDAMQQRALPQASADDVDIVRLALLWTVLLMRQRPQLFRALVHPPGFFCRLAEVFLIGPEAFQQDQSVQQCLTAILDEFLLELGTQNRLTFRLQEPIAGLDAFMPFYGDLLQRFEEFSSGDANFALLLLLGAYMNGSQLDGLLTAQALWSPKRQVVRQIGLRRDGRIELLLKHVAAQRWGEEEPIFEGQERQAIVQEHDNLLGLYVLAMRTGMVRAERNPAMWALAKEELMRRQEREEKQGAEKEGASANANDDLIHAIKEVLSL